MVAWTQILEPGPALLIVLLAASSQVVSGAPLDELEQQSSEIEYYPITDSTGCYYNFQHYDEGDRIITNEPCLNCTCHNGMLMCYLRVCPFTKAVGQDCKVEKRPDQCCPVITCPEVPVHLLPQGSTTPSTAVGHFNEYGCSIDNLFYADGAKVPSNPNNPCEVCYCIRNKTACIIQECTLTGKVVEGCSPVYVDGVCCPVRYDCDHPELETTPRPLLTTTTLPPTAAPTDCIYHNEVYADGALVKKDIPCEQCYCMRGDIVCAVQECGPTPLDKVNCTALPAKEGQCCPDTYECKNISEEDLTTLTYYEAPTTQPTIISSDESVTSSDIEQKATTLRGEDVEEASTQAIEEQASTEPKKQLPEEVVTQSTEETAETEKQLLEVVTQSAGEQHLTETEKQLPETVTQSGEEPSPTETEKQGPETVTQKEEEQSVTETEKQLPETVTQSVGEQVTPETEKQPQEEVTEGPEGVTQGAEEQVSVETEKQLPEGVTQIEEDKTPQPVTESSTIEAITARITEAIESITSRVTGIVETVTSAVSDSSQAAETETEAIATETQPSVTEGIPSVSVHPATDTEIVTEKVSQESETPESEGFRPTEPEAATDMPGILHDDEESHEREPDEDENEISEGSGRPVEEEPVPAVTPPHEIEDKHPTSSDHPEAEQSTTQQAVKETSTSSPSEEAHSTIEPESEITSTEYVSKEKHTTISLESDSHVKETTVPQSVTEEAVKEEPTESPKEGQVTTQKSIPTDSEAQETIQPVEAERTTEHIKPDTSVTPEIVTIINEQTEPTHDTTEEKTVSATDQPREEFITTESHVKEVPVPEEIVTPKIPKEDEAAPTTETKPTEVEGIIITTEKETVEESTQIPVKEETESAKVEGSVTEVTPTLSTGPETDNQVTEKTIDIETTENISDSEQTTSPETDRSQITTESSQIKPVPSVPATCGDKDCKPALEENEIPKEVAVTCTKEGCTPLETPVSETCINGQDCEPNIPGKEYESPVTEKVPVDSSACNTETGCVPEVNKISPEVASESQCKDENDCIPVETTSHDLHTPSVTGEPDTQTTEKQTEVEGSGEDEGVSEHPILDHEEETTSVESLSTVKPDELPKEVIPVQTEKEPESTKPSLVEVSPTTLPSDIEPESEATSIPEDQTQPSKTVTTQETITSEPPKEELATSESDLAVSPIGPKVTETPETTAAGTTEPQEVEVPVSTQRLEGTQEVSTDSAAPAITEQTFEKDSQPTESEIIAETTSAQGVTSENIYTQVSSELPLVTEVNVPEDTEQPTEETVPEKVEPEKEAGITEKPTTPGLKEETTEQGVKSTEAEEGADTVAPSVTEVFESTDIPTVQTEVTESVKSESESPEISATEKTTSAPAEDSGIPGEVPPEGTQSPQPEVPGTSEEPKTESTEESTDESKVNTPESPEGTTPETPETSKPSKQIQPEVSQYPVDTETPVPVTESEPEPSETVPEHGIPGEGSCLVDGQTYKNNSYVPPINQCQTSCKCLSSILQCESIPCTPPPSNLQCTPIFQSPDACCPVYSCSVPGVTSMESDSHIVETTTVPQEEKSSVTSGIEPIPSEAPATSEAVREEELKPTTVQAEVITEAAKETAPEQTVSESQVTEELPVKPTEASATEEPTLHVELTTQGSVFESETTEIVTATEVEKIIVPESSTIISDRQTTVAAETEINVPTEPSREQIPSQDEIENEVHEEPIEPQQCGVDGCVGPTQVTPEEVTSESEVGQTSEPEVSKEFEITTQTTSEVAGGLPETSGTSEQPEESGLKTESPQTSDTGKDESLPQTTEGLLPEKEGELTEVSVTETSQDAITDHNITPTDSGIPQEIATETAETPSKTPEEIAAMPEIEEAVTTPSILPITDTTISEISPKAEQTTISIDVEAEPTTVKEPGVSETVQPDIIPQTETTTRSQFEDSSVPVRNVSTEESATSYQTTVPGVEPVDYTETTPASKPSTEIEYATETEYTGTSSPLVTEAHVTDAVDKETEKQSVTEPSDTETIPEGTVSPLPEENITPESPGAQQTDTLPEEEVTPVVPITEAQPGKSSETEPTEPAEKEPTTSETAATEPSAEKIPEIEPEGTEKPIVSDSETEATTIAEKETTSADVGETSTPIPKVTESKSPTEIEEGTTEVAGVTESEQITNATEGTFSKPEEETTVQEIDKATITKEEPTYTSPQFTTESPVNVSELYTSGPKIDLSTEKAVEGELSTSIPVTSLSSSEAPTSPPPHYTPVPLPGHDISDEKLPDYPTDDYDEEQGPLGPGTCRYGGKVYVSAQQIPRDDPCDFCFCFRSDIICLQQSCPPPIPRCHEEPIRGFCCPRYECPVGMATAVNLTTSTTTTTTTLPPHFLSHAYHGRVTKSGCQIKGRAYQVGDVIPSASGPCLHCTCGGDGEMKCDPKACSPEPMLRQMIAAAATRRRR